MSITVKRAKQLEDAFLGGITEAQDAYEEIVTTEAWTVLGYDTFTEWWSDRVAPLMRQLSMYPTRKVAAKVIEQVRAEEAGLPPLQRRTQAELADLAGVSRPTVGKILGTRADPLKKDGAWRSTEGNYAGVHRRVKKLRGAATDHPCCDCGSAAEQWAYDHEDPNEFWEIVDGRPRSWSADPDHYQAMCRSCHGKLDLGYAAHRENQDRLRGNGFPAADLEQPPTPGADPLPASIAEQIQGRIAERVTRPVPPPIQPPDPEVRERLAREREEQGSREAWSKSLARCVWLLAGYGSEVDAADKHVKDWQPSQDVYPKPTTAERLRAAGDYLYALAERWPQ